MSGWTAALVTYILTIIIAFFCAGMISLISLLLNRRSIRKSRAAGASGRDETV